MCQLRIESLYEASLCRSVMWAVVLPAGQRRWLMMVARLRRRWESVVQPCSPPPTRFLVVVRIFVWLVWLHRLGLADRTSNSAATRPLGGSLVEDSLR